MQAVQYGIVKDEIITEGHLAITKNTRLRGKAP